MPRKRPGVVLTDMQRKFCHEYIIDLNATQAAIRAGYSEDSARSTASHLLDNTDIQDYVRKLQEDAFLRLRITKDEILAELAKIAFAEIEEESFGSAQDDRLTMTRETRRDESDGQVGMRNAECGSEYKENNEAGAGNETNTSIAADEKEIARTNRENRRAVLSYRRVVVDPETGQKTTITFSVQHKIMALRILGMHCGLFVKDKTKHTEEFILIAPKGRTPADDKPQIKDEAVVSK